MTRLLLGLDIGTTRLKAVVLNDDGVELAATAAPTPWVRPGSTPAMMPGALLEQVGAMLTPMLERIPEGRVAGVGISSIAESGVLIDRHGEPLGPILAWSDPRGEQQAERLIADIGHAQFARITGLSASPLCSAVKLRWMFDTEARWPVAGARWLSVAEWLAVALGGRPAAELSLASRTGLLAVQRRAWAPALLDWLGAPSSLLPPLVEAGEPTGHVVGAAPRQMSGAVITVAGHDHLCAAVGAGAIGFDDVLVSCGTAEAIIRPVPPPATGQLAERAVQAGLSLGWHAAPGRLALTGGFAGGQGLERILRLIDRLDPGERDALSRWALGLPETPDGLEVDCVNGVPSLSLGGHGCGPVEVWRAAIWSVVEGAHGVLARAEEVLGRPAKRIAMTGGWLQDPAVHALHRRLLDADRAVVPEAAARGAALLAGCAVGCFPGVDALPGPSEASFHGRPNDGRVARAEQQRVVLASGSHGDNVDSEGS